MLRLKPFELIEPATLAEAVEALENNDGAMITAGGSDLVPKLKREQFDPTVVVSLGGLEGLDFINATDAGVAIGAMTKLRSVERSEAIAGYTALAGAVGMVATPIIRNMGTVGGNLLQDTRCRYYDRSLLWRESIGFCLKKSGDECSVARGANKCFATLCSDLAPALVALDATVTLTGRSERTIPLEDLYDTDDGIRYLRMNNEILTRVDVPSRGYRSTYKKLRLRGGFDFPEVGVAVAAKEEDAGVRVNIGVSGVSSGVFCMKETVNKDALPELLERAFKTMRPMDTLWFPPGHRKAVARNFLQQCLDELLPAG